MYIQIGKFKEILKKSKKSKKSDFIQKEREKRVVRGGGREE